MVESKTASAPLMRASHMQHNISGLAELGQEAEARVRELLQPTTASTIVESPRSMWLPLALDVELTSCVETVVGQQGLFDWSRNAQKKTFEGPLLRPVIDGGLRLFGVRPLRIYKLTPRAFTLMFRNCGEIKIDSKGDCSLDIVHTHAPPGMADGAYLHGSAGAYSAGLDILGFRGSVTVAPREAGNPTVVYEVRWDPKRR